MLVKDVAGWTGVCLCLGSPWHSHSPLLSPTPMRQRAAQHQQLLDSKHKPVYPSPTPLPCGSQKTALAASCPLPAQLVPLGCWCGWSAAAPPTARAWASLLTTSISAGLARLSLRPSVLGMPAFPFPMGTGQPTGAQSAWHMKELTTFPSYPVPFFVLMTLGRAPVSLLQSADSSLP